MPDVTPLSPELSRSVSGLARALVAASRSWALYPPEHPAVRSAIDRLRTALAIASSGRALSFGVTLDTLLVEGCTVASERPVADAARWLHQHDILQMTVAGDVPVESLEALLALLSEDVPAVRSRGGPAEAWRALHQGAMGTLVRLGTDEVAVVTREHPTDPFRPQVKVVRDSLGERVEQTALLNTWEPDRRGEFPHAVVEAVDPEMVHVDPLSYM